MKKEKKEDCDGGSELSEENVLNENGYDMNNEC